MLEGVMVYGHGESRYTLRVGDALQFDGEGPHGPAELTELPIKFLSLIAYGDEGHAEGDHSAHRPPGVKKCQMAPRPRCHRPVNEPRCRSFPSSRCGYTTSPSDESDANVELTRDLRETETSGRFALL